MVSRQMETVNNLYIILYRQWQNESEKNKKQPNLQEYQQRSLDVIKVAPTSTL